MKQYKPKTIHRDLQDLKLLFPILMNNVKYIKYFIKKIEDGRKEKD